MTLGKLNFLLKLSNQTVQMKKESLLLNKLMYRPQKKTTLTSESSNVSCDLVASKIQASPNVRRQSCPFQPRQFSPCTAINCPLVLHLAIGHIFLFCFNYFSMSRLHPTDERICPQFAVHVPCSLMHHVQVMVLPAAGTGAELELPALEGPAMASLGPAAEPAALDGPAGVLSPSVSPVRSTTGPPAATGSTTPKMRSMIRARVICEAWMFSSRMPLTASMILL